MWRYRGHERPPFADEPGPGQESVWDFPRPPRVEPCGSLVVVRSGEIEVARSSSTHRVLETASPPGYYIPAEDVDWDLLRPSPGQSVCEWKGFARYWKLAGDRPGTAIGWSYDEPTPAFDPIRGSISFYPGLIDCSVEGEPVRPQPGSFYGGWVTDRIAGPFKGGPGSGDW